MIICGIDEAGRGPLLGPLVMCGVSIEKSNLPQLAKLGLKDSKLLSEKKRNEFYKIIKQLAKVKIIKLQPRDIDKSLNDPKCNLNLLEAKSTAKILKYLKPDTAYIDLPEKYPDRYNKKITTYLNKSINPKLISEHKADYKYPIVSAASIIAKVERDKVLKQLRKTYPDIGSGYPSDQTSKDFLKKHYKNPDLKDVFRKTWASYKNIVEENQQKSMFDF